MAIEPFTQLTSRAHVIDAPNIDTDIIFPARFLLIIEREGMGQYAFHDWRTGADGSENLAFPAPELLHGDRRILVAGPNFGCGSSREQAVWALADLGLRCIIAPGFGEIFYNNCFKSGLLPIALPDLQLWSRLREAALVDQPLTVDLETCQVTAGAGPPVEFTLSHHRRNALLNGLDDIDMVLEQDGDEIRAFEAKRRAARPWLFTPLG
ncbi:MAG: 3-isopropylmalate dehydratase small subunit [Chromatocurvus sp.]